MIVTWRLAIRIALIVILTVMLQVSFFSYITVFGVAPDVVTVMVVCLGLLGGAVFGAVVGFGTGLLLDSVLLQTLGASSLVLLTAGYLAGRYREAADISNSLIPPLIAGGLTLLAAGAFAAIELMLGVDVPVSLLILREIILKGLLAILLAMPIYPLVRRALRPGLVEDAPAHRVLTSTVRQRRRRVGRLRRMVL